jgi:hypothetical protein
MSVVATDEDLVNKNLKEQAQAVWEEIYDQYKRCDPNNHDKLKYLQGCLDCCGLFAGYSKLSEFRVFQKLVKSKEEKKGERKLPPKVYEEPKQKSKSAKKKK